MKFKQIKPTNFGNQYGGLSLIETDDGNQYLRMGHGYGATLYGPVNEQHVAALELLNALPAFIETDEFDQPL